MIISNDEEDNKVISDYLFKLGFERLRSTIPSEWYFSLEYTVPNDEIKGISKIEVYMDLGTIDVYYYDYEKQMYNLYGYEKSIKFIKEMFKHKIRKDKIKKLFGK